MVFSVVLQKINSRNSLLKFLKHQNIFCYEATKAICILIIIMFVAFAFIIICISYLFLIQHSMINLNSVHQLHRNPTLFMVVCVRSDKPNE